VVEHLPHHKAMSSNPSIAKKKRKKKKNESFKKMEYF
jgi:hypothetical protein